VIQMKEKESGYFQIHVMGEHRLLEKRMWTCEVAENSVEYGTRVLGAWDRWGAGKYD
jgi:hypothetical protein